MNLSGKTALVCGASKGIGAATCQALADQGARVVLLARSLEGVQEVQAKLSGEGHLCQSLDLNKSVELQAKAQQILEEVGSVDILVCNSGGPKGGPLIAAQPEEFVQAFQQHVVANQILAQAFVPGMKEKSYGRIINIISTSVKVPIANLGVSNTIRGAVASWAKTLANELGASGITVNNVLPGFTATERLSTLKEGAAKRLSKTLEEVDEMWINSVPARRFAQPEETAQAIAFLASPAASYINGVNLPVDGGRTGCL